MIVAADEASLYLQATRQAIWHPRGLTPVIKLHPGRVNSHFYGALNLQTGQEVVMRSPVMNAETSALFLHKLLTTFPDQPILLLWDRAPWHQGVEITTLLKANPRLEFWYTLYADDLVMTASHQGESSNSSRVCIAFPLGST